MKSLMAVVTAGLACGVITLSASAQTASGNGSIAAAPPLALSGDGPISATFLGASAPFRQLNVGWVDPTGFSTVGFFFSFDAPAPGAVFSVTPTTGPGGPVPPGSDVFFNAWFTDPADASRVALSSTAVSPEVAAALTGAGPGFPSSSILFNSGVVQSGPDGLLIGFNAPGAAFPASFGGFGVRIAVDNVCLL